MVIRRLDGALVNILPGEVFEHPDLVFYGERVAADAVGGGEPAPAGHEGTEAGVGTFPAARREAGRLHREDPVKEAQLRFVYLSFTHATFFQELLPDTDSVGHTIHHRFSSITPIRVVC